MIDRKIQNNGHKYPTIFGYRFARSLFVPKENYSSSKYPICRFACHHSRPIFFCATQLSSFLYQGFSFLATPQGVSESGFLRQSVVTMKYFRQKTRFMRLGAKVLRIKVRDSPRSLNRTVRSIYGLSSCYIFITPPSRRCLNPLEGGVTE